MKELVIFLHVITNPNNQDKTNWLNEFKGLFSNALEKYKISVKSITTDKEKFKRLIGGYTQGIYMPIINKDFLDSKAYLSEFKLIKNEIENRVIQNTTQISVIEDVLPINYAQYQPFFKFFNQGQFSQSTNQIDSHLPGNNTRISFQKNIQALSKEVSEQLLRLTSVMQGGKKVIIGASTNDLDEPLKSLYNYLIDQNIEVEAPSTINTSGETENYIKNKIAESLKQCWLYIHPFGDGVIDSNYMLGNSLNLCEVQNEVSSNYFQENKNDVLNENPFQRIIWLPKTISSSSFEGRLVDRIKNQAIQDKSAEILSCSLDELKRVIIDYHKTLGNDSDNYEPETDNFEEINTDQETVFVLFENSYCQLLGELESILSNNNLKMITCNDFDKTNDFISSKTSILKNCKGVILLSTSWISNWFVSNLNEVLKVKSSRISKKYDFLCVMSKEISELPYNFDEDINLIRINGDLNSHLIKTVLLNMQ